MGTVNQPIIRGIQAVGQVVVRYRYNKLDGTDYVLPIPADLIALQEAGGATKADKIIIPEAGVDVAGFRLDSTFLAANPQIASSAVIPILGGGGVALTNNNRTGTLSLTCAKVSTPEYDSTNQGKMIGGDAAGIGVRDGKTVYDLVFLAQIQQGQTGGDSVGATLLIGYEFCGRKTQMTFEGCTVADVAPIVLAGNDAATYQVNINYLNWAVKYNVGSFTME